jgi:hypothetical protein
LKNKKKGSVLIENQNSLGKVQIRSELSDHTSINVPKEQKYFFLPLFK